MNSNFLYSKAEWEKIEEYAFSREAPDPEFSESYKKRREEIISRAGNNRGRIKRSSVIAAAIAAAALIPTTAFAIGKIGAYIEKTGKYEKTVHIYSEKSSDEKIKELRFGWLPEGMVYNEGGSFEGKYTDSPGHDSGRCITSVFWKVGADFSLPVRYTSSHEEYTCKNGASAFIIKRDKGFDQLWVIFNGTPYAAQIYANGFNEDELKKIADGLTLLPSDTETAAIWQELEEPVPSDTEEKVSQNIENINLCSAGETLDMGGIKVHIDSVEVQDDFRGITTDSIGRPADYSGYLDDSGKITDERIIIALGDGINSLDTELSREKVTRNVIVMNLTAENTDEADKMFLINSRMFRLLDGIVVGLSAPNLTPEQNYAAHYKHTDNLDTDDGAFSYYADSENTEKNSVTLKTGESVSVRLAFMADNDLLDTLYFDILNQGESVEESIGSQNPVLKLK